MRLLAPTLLLLVFGCADEGASRSDAKDKDADEAAASASKPAAAEEGEAKAAADSPAPPRPQAAPPSPADDKAQKSGRRRVRLAVVKGLGGALTQAQVEETIEGARDALQRCYGSVEARLEVSLQIGATGEVADAAVTRSEPAQPRQSECAKLTLEKLKFPAPQSSVKLDLQIFLDPQR